MKYASIMVARQGAVDIPEAENLLGGPKILELARKAGWLTAKIQEKKLTRFDYGEVVTCWKRICSQGYAELKAAAVEATR